MKFVVTEKDITTELGYGRLNISGNEAEGFRPFQLIVSGLVGCSALVFRRILEKQRLSFEEFIIETDLVRNEAEANKIEKISLTFKIKGENLDEKKLKRNLELSRKYCSMVRSVEDSIEIVEELQVL